MPATWQLPMLAQLVKPVEHRPGVRSNWIYERKLDGLRCLAVRNGERVELWSRNHLSFNARFPGIEAALARLSLDSFTLDGEIVAFDQDRTSFSLLQRPTPGTRVQYCVFDVLYLLGQDTTHLPLSDRRALVARCIEDAPEALYTSRALHGDPATLLSQACEQGWEGLVAKRLASPYQAGRSGDWQKLKCSASQELVIAGWTDPTGSRVGLGAILVGYYDDAGQLRYAGKVGTGFDQQQLRELHSQLQTLSVDASPFADPVPFRGAHWAKPELVAAVSFTEWTRDGRLRHPSFQGMRTDKEARAVVREARA